MSSIENGRHSPAPQTSPGRPESPSRNLSQSTDHIVHSMLDVFFATNLAKSMIGDKQPVLLFRSARDFALSRLHGIAKDQIKSGLKSHEKFAALLRDPEVQKFIRDENSLKQSLKSQQSTTRERVRSAVERKPIAKAPRTASLQERGNAALKRAFDLGNIKAIEKITKILGNGERVEIRPTKEAEAEMAEAGKDGKELPLEYNPYPKGRDMSIEEARHRLIHSFRKDAVFTEASGFVILQNGDVVDFPELVRVAGHPEINAFRIVQITSVTQNDEAQDYKYEITCLARGIYHDAIGRPDGQKVYTFFDNEELKIRVPKEGVGVGGRLRVFRGGKAFFEAKIASKLRIIDNKGKGFFSKMIPRSIQANARFIH